ncbi:WYL domain-containing protein [Brachybacterium sp. J153]|uniref:WYL domain-containing protein n=1 Tax=Brachybacterium sp. J153 TaxID=3116488 RepID=UPI002E76C089|nr:WYL domain-containing protein [Brachybacterium sp. J153]MEE1617406.1 WYL domain-containing protein [Brachybacterium sp. J153]
MAAKGVERLLNVIMTIGSRRRIDRRKLFAVIPDYAEAASETARERMFERDKASILELGLPLTTEKDVLDENTVYYRIDSPRAGAVLDLTAAEYTVLLAASRAWDAAAAGGAARRVRAKLLSLGHDADPDLLRRTPRGAVESLPVLSPLLEAVTAGHGVRFVYRTAQGSPAERRVEPWVVGVHEGHWYVHGWDLDREAPRVFRASRIESFPAALPASTRPRPEGIDLATALESLHTGDDRAPATLRVEPFKALAIRDRAGAPLEAREVTLPELPRTAARRLVLGNLRWLELTGPDSWRQELLEVLAALRAAHEGAADLTALEAAPVRPRPRIRTTATDRDVLSRLISEASYVMSRGEVELAELAAAVGVTEKQLIDDLQVLFVCGDMGTGWEDLIEAEWEAGTVRVRNADPLRRALRLTPPEITALLAGLATLEEAAGEAESVLESARAKLLAGLRGEDADVAADREPTAGDPASAAPDGDPVLPTAREVDDAIAADATAARTADRAEAVLAAVQRALAAGDAAAGALTIRYSSADRPGTSVRRIRPERIETDGSRSYLIADCELAEGPRRFRLDRIVELLPDGTPQSRAEDAAGAELGGRVESEVWLALEPPAHWIAESFAAGELRDGENGRTFARLDSPIRAALVDAVLEAAGAAEVLSPSDLRDTIVTVARAADARHSQTGPLP